VREMNVVGQSGSDSPLVDAETLYNILMGKPSLNKLGAIVSTPHIAMKFPTDSKSRGRGVMTLHVDQKTVRECYAASLRIPRSTPSRRLEVHQVRIMNDLDHRPNDEPTLKKRLANQEKIIVWVQP